VAFVSAYGVDIEAIIAKTEAFDKIELFEAYANSLLESDERRREFGVRQNVVKALYEACRPEIILIKEQYRVVQILSHLRGLMDAYNDPGSLSRARSRIGALLDESVVTQKGNTQDPAATYAIATRQVIDLSHLDSSQIKLAYRESPYKNIEASELRAFVTHKLEQLLQQNATRGNFAERLQEIINRYNANTTANENYFDELVAFAETLRAEEKRHIKEGLTEDELELFDLLEKPNLTEAEKQSVKLAAQHLLKRLRDEKPTVLVQDWHRDTQTRLQVVNTVKGILNQHLPNSYDRMLFQTKVEGVTLHLSAHSLKYA
jgi:type I restriction enzyme, R subunit